MQITVDLPESLLRRAKAAAALQGRTLRELVQEGLERVLAEPAAGASGGPSACDLMEGGCGMSGLTPSMARYRRYKVG